MGTRNFSWFTGHPDGWRIMTNQNKLSEQTFESDFKYIWRVCVITHC